ncbi:MAG: JAB domain-containing protein [Dehalococcoidia bacterium]
MQMTSYRSFKVKELHVRFRATRYTSPGKITCPQDIHDLVAPMVKGVPRERLISIALDSPHNIVGFEIVSQGTSDTALATPREILKAVLLTNSSAFVVAHNHPSGNCEPSLEDRQIAKRIAEAAAILDIQLLDFVIVTDAELYSFAQSDPAAINK